MNREIVFPQSFKTVFIRIFCGTSSLVYISFFMKLECKRFNETIIGGTDLQAFAVSLLKTNILQANCDQEIRK